MARDSLDKSYQRFNPIRIPEMIQDLWRANQWRMAVELYEWADSRFHELQDLVGDNPSPFGLAMQRAADYLAEWRECEKCGGEGGYHATWLYQDGQEVPWTWCLECGGACGCVWPPDAYLSEDQKPPKREDPGPVVKGRIARMAL